MSKLDKARWWVLREHVFYGALTFQLKDEIVPSLPNGTAGTDGRRILWDKTFLESLSDEETRFVLLHETLHCAHGHCWRLPASDPDAQIACDLVINSIISKLPGCKMPKGGAFDLSADGKSEEQIYAGLKNKPKQKQGQDSNQGKGNEQGQQQGQDGDIEGDQQSDGTGSGDGQGKGKPKSSPDPGKCGSFEPAKGLPEQKEELKAQWQQAVIMAAQQAGLQKGDLPGDLARLAGESCVLAKPDWRAETADWLRSVVNSTKNDWARSRKRMAGQAVIYARQKANDLGLVIAARDTSGSIDDSVLGKFNELLAGLMSDTGCRILLIDCDAQVNAEYELTSEVDIPKESKGGGGTDFRPVFDRVQELIEGGEQIAGVVYLTDLYGDFPNTEPNCPVLWVATTDQSVPWGRVTRV